MEDFEYVGNGLRRALDSGENQGIIRKHGSEFYLALGLFKKLFLSWSDGWQAFREVMSRLTHWRFGIPPLTSHAECAI
jgi:hypothetical protein